MGAEVYTDFLIPPVLGFRDNLEGSILTFWAFEKISRWN